MITPRTEAEMAMIRVERAIRDLRSGLPVAVAGAGGECLAAWPAEAALRENALPRATGLALAITAARAGRLLGRGVSGRALRVSLERDTDIFALAALIDPEAASLPARARALLSSAAPARALEQAALALMKHGSLIPAALTAPCSAGEAERAGLLAVPAAAIESYREALAGTLTPAGEARVPLDGAENARIVAFRPRHGAAEHLAILVGAPEKEPAPLVRVHSSCLTGDLLGSLRCDCGAQLRAALARIGGAGSGAILYLNQEGRGIGIANKLRAYALQDNGLDTLDANEQLGFDADERHFRPAAEMLKLLSIPAIRILTNNPGKVAAMERYGIEVRERLPLAVEAGEHNREYLETKARRCGHVF